MVVRNLVGGHRWAATVAAFAVAIAAVAAVAPGSSNATPSQEGPGDSSAGDDALVAIDVDVADGDAVAITGALDEMQANVGAQLNLLAEAEANISETLERLADADAAIQVTEDKIDSLTGASDSVVVTRYMNPPSEGAIESLTAESMSDATVKQALLEMRADEDAEKLAELTAARQQLEEQEAHEVEVRTEAEKAKTAAEAALVDVQAAFGQQTKFILDVKNWLADPDGALALRAGSPEESARIQSMADELTGKIAEIEAAEVAREAEEAEAEARRRILRGGFSCPVDGPMSFTDTWGDPRPGGRVHKGTDMMAATGTPVVAPVNGRLVHKGDSIGGMSFFLYGDDGHEYFGTHLSQYENQGAGWVEAGTLIGRVGSTGNASSPHLHFSYYPNGGSPTNPYPRLNEVCPHS